MTNDNDRLAEIEARAKAATEGPWGVLPGARSNLAHVETQEGCVPQGFNICSIPKKRMADADFIAHARADIPFLIARVRELEQRAADERAAERKAVVAFLCDGARSWRDKGNEMLDRDSGESCFRRAHAFSDAAADIERGEHLTKPEPTE